MCVFPPGHESTEHKPKPRKRKRHPRSNQIEDGTDNESEHTVKDPRESNNDELISLEAASTAGVRFVAHESIQNAAVGLYGAHLTRFPLSDVQRRTLMRIGAAGTKGAFQNELSAQEGADNKNFFYVIKNLEQRGLVVKRPCVVQVEAKNSHFSSHVQTNVVHLTKFDPGVSKSARLTDGKNSVMVGAPAAPGGEQSLYVVDDNKNLSDICSTLEKTDGATVLESELKRVIGFSGTKGHRLWRRLKAVLVRRGFIEEFLATQRNKPVKCIKLLKPWNEEDDERDGDDDGHLLNFSTGNQVAEASLDRQLFEIVLASGDNGVTTADLDVSMRLNMKRAKCRLDDLKNRFGIIPKSVNQGRMITLRYKAPDSVLQQYRIAPLAPPQGWEVAVRDAMTAGLDEGEELCDVSKPPTVDEACIVANFSHTTTPSVPPQVEANPQVTAGYTQIADRRLGWLLKKIEADGFMLSSEVGRYLMECEQVEGNPAAILPDRKTNNRIIKRAIDEGLICTHTLNFPATHGSLQNRTHTILARPGIKADESFINDVFEHYKQFQKRIRKNFHVRHLAAAAEAQGQALPQVHLPSLAPMLTVADVDGELGALVTKSKQDAINTLKANGFLVARAARARLLHEIIADLVEAQAARIHVRGQQGLHQGQSLFLVSHLPAGEGASQGLDVALNCDGSALGEYLVTAQDIWDYMTVSQFVQVIGTACPDSSRIERLAERTMGLLSQEESNDVLGETLYNDRPRSRLSQLLDLLCRLGLISAAVPVGHQAVVSAVGASSYVFRTEASVHDTTSPDTSLLKYSMTITTERDDYWDRLAWTVFSIGGVKKGRPGETTGLHKFYPFSSAQEMVVERAWGTRSSIPAQHITALENALSGDAVPSFDKIKSVAHDIGVPFLSALMYATMGAAARTGGRKPIRLGRLGGTSNKSRFVGRQWRKKHIILGGDENVVVENGLDEDEDEFDDEKEDYERGDDVARVHYRPVLQRKKKWYKSEDRQLLRAWAAYLINHGPDKDVYWRSMPGRPSNLQSTTLKHRLRTLKKATDTGPLVYKVIECASQVYQRRVLRDDESAGKSPRVPPENLFNMMHDEADEADHKEITKAIEAIVASAPKQFNDPEPPPRTFTPGQPRRDKGSGMNVLFRPWALKRSRHTPNTGAMPPLGPGASAAADFILHVLYSTLSSGAPSEQAEQLLSTKFSEGEVSAALQWLVHRKLLSISDTRRQALRPSERLKSQACPLKVPVSLFEQTLDGPYTGRSVALILEGLSRGSAHLGVEKVVVRKGEDEENGVALSRLADHSMSLSAEVALTIDQKEPEVMGATIIFPKEMVYFQPSLVYADSAALNEAKAACKSPKDVSTDEVLQVLAEKADRGLKASDAPFNEGVLLALREYGLARAFMSQSETVYVSLEASQRWLAFPHFSAQDSKDCVKNSLHAAGIGEQGILQECCDLPCSPWLDCQGEVDASILRGLAQRALSVAMRHPGVPEDLMLSNLEFAGQHGRLLLTALCRTGALCVRNVEIGPVSSSALAACFGEHETTVQMQRCYFTGRDYLQINSMM